LNDVWFLQRNSDDAKNPLSLAKFEGVFWGPENKLYINEKDIIWKAKLREDSQVLHFIKNPQTLQNQPSIQPSEQTNLQPKS